jgi:hypothetical protein
VRAISFTGGIKMQDIATLSIHETPDPLPAFFVRQCKVDNELLGQIRDFAGGYGDIVPFQLQADFCLRPVTKEDGDAYVHQNVIAEGAPMSCEPEKPLGTIGGRVLTMLASSHDFMGAKSSDGQGGNGLGSSLCYGQPLDTIRTCVDAGLKVKGGQIGKHRLGGSSIYQTVHMLLQGRYKGISGVFFSSP